MQIDQFYYSIVFNIEVDSTQEGINKSKLGRIFKTKFKSSNEQAITKEETVRAVKNT